MNLVPPSIRIFFGATAAVATTVALAGAEAPTTEKRVAFLLLAAYRMNLCLNIHFEKTFIGVSREGSTWVVH